jgi:hypothetical protein
MSLYFKVQGWNVTAGWHDMYHVWSGAAAQRKVAMVMKNFKLPKKNFRIVKVVEEVMKF